MKKRGILLGILAVILACLPMLAFASEYQAQMAAGFAIVTNGRLNLRSTASSASTSLGVYSGGSWVRLMGYPSNGWWPVSTTDGKSGYMYGSYLTFASAEQSGQVRYANGGYVNLRSGPSLDYSIVVQVTSGTSLTILDASSEWLYVRAIVYGVSYQGYMHESLVNRGSGYAQVSTRHGGKVNVRSGPSFTYGTIGSLPTGTSVSVLLKGNGWSLISGGGLTGFMSTVYLSSTSVVSGYTYQSTPTVTTPVSYTVAYVKNPRSTQVLNLRESASQSSRSIGQYRNGTQVRVVSRGSVWCEVYVGTRHGYMMTQYLSFSGSVPVAQQTVQPYVPSQPYYTAIPIMTAIPTATPAPRITAQPTSAIRDIVLVSTTGGNAVNVFNDVGLTSLKSTYMEGKTAKLLSYGDNVCLILVDNGVGYVPTANVRY